MALLHPSRDPQLQYILRTFLCALAAEDAFGMFRISFFHTSLHIDAHRTCLNANAAVNAVLRFRDQAELRKSYQISELAAENHEGSHPAYVMTACTLSKRKTQYHKEEDDDVVNNKERCTGNGYASFYMKKRLDLHPVPIQKQKNQNHREPDSPNPVFNQVFPACRNRSVLDIHTCILQSSAAHKPAAGRSSDKESQQEQAAKDQNTAGNNPADGTVDRQIRGKIK